MWSIEKPLSGKGGPLFLIFLITFIISRRVFYTYLFFYFFCLLGEINYIYSSIKDFSPSLKMYFDKKFEAATFDIDASLTLYQVNHRDDLIKLIQDAVEGIILLKGAERSVFEERNEITKYFADEVCNRIVGESYYRWDSVTSYYPTIILKEDSEQRPLRHSQIKLRYNKLSNEVKDQDIEEKTQENKNKKENHKENVAIDNKNKNSCEEYELMDIFDLEITDNEKEYIKKVEAIDETSLRHFNVAQENSSNHPEKRNEKGVVTLNVDDSSVNVKETQLSSMQFSFTSDGKTKKKRVPQPILFQLDEEKLQKYSDIYQFLFFNGQRSKHTSWEYCRVIEMVVFNNLDEVKKINFTMELPLIFKLIWLSYDNGHPMIIYVQDHVDGTYYTHDVTFKKSRVPYIKLSESEVLKCIKDWILRLFRGNPPSNLTDYEFTSKVLRNLKLDISLNRTQLIKDMPPGVAFSTGYVYKKEGQRLLSFIEYSKDTFVDECIQINPVPYIFESSSKEKYRKVLISRMSQGLLTSGGYEKSEESELDQLLAEAGQVHDDPLERISSEFNDKTFQTFLKVITESDPIKAVAIRSLIHRVINAPKEGRRYHQAYWFYGAPAASKSFIVSVLKYFAQGHYVELSRTQNQFTAASFVNAKLIIVSDINRISQEMVEMLRKILGRDTLYAEEKHKGGYIIVEPYAQVVFTSNDGPEAFPEIFTKPGFKDKVTAIRFNRSISEKHMISDMAPALRKYSNHFFIWGMLTPQIYLDQQSKKRFFKK